MNPWHRLIAIGLMCWIPVGPGLGSVRVSQEHVRSGVTITEVRNIGISAANTSRSIIQVTWTATIPSESPIEIRLEITYADNATERCQTMTAGTARSCRFEVPTVHQITGHPAAEMKRYQVIVTTNQTESARKHGTF